MGKIEIHVEDNRLAQFMCPACNKRHTIAIAGAGAWYYNGNASKPTITPSILCTIDYTDGQDEYIPEGYIKGLNKCHSFITDGKIQYLDDCTHTMAGQTVELPELVQ